MSPITFLCLMAASFICCTTNSCSEAATIESSWNRPEQVTLVAPKIIRSHSLYHVMLHLANSSQPATFDLKLICGTRTLSKSLLINPDQSQLLAFPIGEWSAVGASVLSLNVSALDKSWYFGQQKQLAFEPQKLSILIQTSKTIYKPGQTLHFRALFLTTTTRQPVSPNANSITVQVSDPRGNLIKQWKEVRVTQGLASFELPLAESPPLGNWCIKVKTRANYQQEVEKEFTVAEYTQTAFDVQLSVPRQAAFDADQHTTNIVATVRSGYTYGKPVRGKVTLSVEQGDAVKYACSHIAVPFNGFRIYQTLVDGVAEFNVPFHKLATMWLVNEEPSTATAEESPSCEFKFIASVEEEQTGRKYNRSQSVIIHGSDTKIDWLISKNDKLASFKAGLNYTTMFRVIHQDGSPVTKGGSDELVAPIVELEYLLQDKTVESFNLRPSGSGLIEHSWQVPRQVEDLASGQLMAPQSMSIRIKCGGSHFVKHIPRSCSASNQFMQITVVAHSKATSKRKKRQSHHLEHMTVNVGDELRLRIDATQPIDPLVSCHGMSHGDIVWTSSIHSHNKTIIEFDLPISSNMTPSLEVVCFYTNQEYKELIADSLRIPVLGLTQNFARIQLSQDEAQPGQSIDVEVQARPESLIGLLAMDHSASLLESSNHLTDDQVEDSLAGDSQASHDVYHSTAESLFDLSGAIIMTTNIIQSESAYQKVMPSSSRLDEEMSDEDEMNMIPAASSSDGDEMLAEESGVVEAVTLKEKASFNQPVEIDSFPETWIWTNGTADLEGRFRLSAKVPEAFASYSLSAFSTSSIYGFGVSNQQANFRVFKPIFIKLHAPYSMIKGETASILATVNNDSEEPISAKVVLYNKHGEFDFVDPANRVKDEKYSRANQIARKIIVSSRSSKTISFLITPNKLGNIDLKAVVSSDSSVISALHRLQVKPQGKTQHKNQAVLVNLNRNQKGRLTKNFTISWPADNVVEGSEKIFVSIVGDVVGLSLKNVNNLLRMPYGCGEQNMIHLVPNIVILNYLEATGRSSPKTRNMILTNIEKGYQQQLNFKRSDGSFSAFGELDGTGSVWLTAYVVKHLQQAKDLIDVDERMLTDAVGYLTRFSLEDGSIREAGMIHNQWLSSQNRPTAYLTAYCMIALHSSQMNFSKTHSNEVESRLEELINHGLSYLESQLETALVSSDTYQLSIISYALHLHDKTRMADKAHEGLWKRAIKSKGSIWWEAKRKEASPLDRKRSTQEPDSLSIETTAFALLTLVRRGELELATSVASWLVSKQNSHGGFVSTQDTVLAIEALTSFSRANAAITGPSDMSVRLLYTRNAGQTNHLNMDQYEISSKSSLALHRIQLPTDTKWVEVTVVGSGSGTVQVSHQYNLLEYQIEKPAFHLRAILNSSEANQSRMNLKVCTYYKLDEASNMAVVDVKLPSGYTLDVKFMRNLLGVDLVKKVEFFSHDSRVEIYLNRLTGLETCIPVEAFRNWKVSNNKPGSVGVYDYYDRKNAARTLYGPKIASSCDICEADMCPRGCKRWKKSTG